MKSVSGVHKFFGGLNRYARVLLRRYLLRDDGLIRSTKSAKILKFAMYGAGFLGLGGFRVVQKRGV